MQRNRFWDQNMNKTENWLQHCEVADWVATDEDNVNLRYEWQTSV